MDINWRKVTSPFINREPDATFRDQAVVCCEGVFYDFCSEVHRTADTYDFYLVATQSADLIHWTEPKRLVVSEMNFSAPGNVINVGGKWVMCLQTYVIDPGEPCGNGSNRLYMMESHDLVEWSGPKPLRPEGAQVRWTDSKRQIDPFLIRHNDSYYCFYKTSGCLGLMESKDLERWKEVDPGNPVISSADTPDGEAIENPYIVQNGNEFVMFISSCREGRGIQTARSADLMHWRDIRYLDFPAQSWAPGGPTAPCVLDLRREFGKWVMFFHGEMPGHYHSAALGIAWSSDLIHWECNELGGRA